MENDQDFSDWIREMQRSDQPEIVKLEAYFGTITSRIVAYAEKEIELASALGDHESLIKHQVKMETLKTARAIFARGYQIATGRKAWDEQDRC